MSLWQTLAVILMLLYTIILRAVMPLWLYKLVFLFLLFCFVQLCWLLDCPPVGSWIATQSSSAMSFYTGPGFQAVATMVGYRWVDCSLVWIRTYEYGHWPWLLPIMMFKFISSAINENVTWSKYISVILEVFIVM